MPYRITRHADDLLWVVMEGHLSLDHADAYFHELWGTLDGCPNPTDLLVDGRRIGGASPSARRRTEQIAHHPHLGHLAFVVSEGHMLIFAPFVKLVSGIGLFGSEHEALDYLRVARGLPPVADLALPTLPPSPLATEPAPAAAPAEAQAVGDPGRPLPPPPTPRVPARLLRSSSRGAAPPAPPAHHLPPPPAPRGLPTITDIVDGWASGLRNAARRIERD